MIISDFEQYKDKEEIIIKKGVLNNFYDINNFLEIIDLEKLKTLDCNFTYIDTLINIERVFSGDIVMTVLYHNETIKEYLLNLPQQIDILVFKNLYTNTFLEGCFTNLPVSIKKILFVFASTIELLKYTGELNILFGAKLPFDCIMEVLISDKKYIVQQENINDNELTLFSETGEKIIVKYVKKNSNIDDYKHYNVLRIMSGMGGLAFSS